MGSTPVAGRRPSPINWRQEYLHFSVMAMTACWLAGWVTLTLNWFIDISLAAVLSLCGVHLAASTLLIRVAVRRRLSNRLTVSSILFLMWIAAMLTILTLPLLAKAYGGDEALSLASLFRIDEQQRVPAGPVVVIWVWVLWWRGYQLGEAYVTLVRVSFGLRLGILSFLLVALVSSQSLRAELLVLVPFFFFFGLLGSSLARADSLNLDRARKATSFGRGWIVSLFALTLGVTALGYLAALMLAGMDTGTLARILASLGRGAVTLIFVLATPILYLAQVGYDFVISILPERRRGDIVETPTGVSSGGGVNAPWVSDMFEIVTNAFLIAFGALIVIGALAFIWFLVVSRGESRRHDDLEEREFLGTGEVVGGLRETLRQGWRRLAETMRLFRQFGLGQDLFAAMTIRRIYQRMERLAGERGYPRGLADTPYEYRQALYQAFPGQVDAVQHITDAYVAVRYGDVPETADELHAVRAAWARLHSTPASHPG